MRHFVHPDEFQERKILFGERAVTAILKGYMQLDQGPILGEPVFGAISYDQLIRDEKKKI